MKISPARLFASHSFRLGLGLVASGLSLYLALRSVTLQEVWAALSQANLGYAGLALASVAANTLAKTFRWRALLGRPGRAVSVYKLFQALLVGQMLNTLYPARIGDLSRAYVIGGLGPGRVYTLATVLLEKLLDMLSYSLLFLLLIILMPLPGWVNDSGYSFSLAVLAASAAVLIVAYRPDGFVRLFAWATGRLPERLGAYLLGRLSAGMSSLEVLQDRSGVLELGFWSVVTWGTAILNNFLVLLALQIYLPWTAALLVLIVLQAGISIPSVPGRIGIFEYMCVLALAVFGIEQAPAVSYGIVLHSVVMIPTTLLGLLFFACLGLGGGWSEEKFELLRPAGRKRAGY